MKSRVNVIGLWMVTAALMATLVAGCSRTTAQKSSESDSNGYVCLKCKTKFYTGRSVFADKCPECGVVQVETVYGYVCEVDPVDKPEDSKPGCGAITLAPRGVRGLKCQQCGQPVHKISLPSGEALAKWGATKAAKDKVLIPR